MIAANSVMQSIDSGELADKINKYIAPEFSVKQGDNYNKNNKTAMIKV